MDAIDEFLTRGVDSIYPSKEEFKQVLTSGRKLRMYLGIDPTGEKLHIGHTVPLWKLRQFQDAGHTAILLIGDYTGMAGDPSGKMQSRGGLRSREELLKNSKHYQQQAAKILRFSGENPIELRYNSEWGLKLTHLEWLQISAHFTLQQLEERDMFEQRKKKSEPILFSEFQYPLIQAYDFVMLNADIQLGGTDQTFNMLAGRTLNKIMKKKDVFVLTVPLLADASGRKIGKTEGNVIGITDPPNDLFGKIMALPDEVIGRGFELLTPLPFAEVRRLQKELQTLGANPMVYKKKLAYMLVALYNSQEVADKAQSYFEQTVQKKQLPGEQIESYVTTDRALATVAIDCGLVASVGELKRLIKQGGVYINNHRVTSLGSELSDGDIIRRGSHRLIRFQFKK